MRNVSAVSICFSVLPRHAICNMSREASKRSIENLLEERRSFTPSSAFVASANLSDPTIYAQADSDPEGWWVSQDERLDWFERWSEVHEWDPPFHRWFISGKLNIAHSCLDRHLTSNGSRVAYHWIGEPGEERSITYAELRELVARLANVLKNLGVGKRRSCRDLPSADSRTAPHSVVFGGFSADALRDRINDAEAKILITADGGYRRGEVAGLPPHHTCRPSRVRDPVVPLKTNADRALKETPFIQNALVVRRTNEDVEWTEGRDLDLLELAGRASNECPPEAMDSEDTLYILYTSGTTGRPKGIVHTTGGYLTGVSSTHHLIFDIKPESDVYWCAADIGWVTGHSYIVYGPLANDCTSILYEGAPDWPDKDRWWSIVEKYGATILYTAPTAIRTFMKWGTDHPGKHDLSSLRLLGSVGEPINPEAGVWYQEFIGEGRTLVVDTWWQIETGAIAISALPGITTLKPGSATKPFPGVAVDVWDKNGRPVGRGGGNLVLTRPIPSMFRTIFGDEEGYRDTYFSRCGDEVYFAGDGAKVDEDGYFWLLRRVDDVMNIAGHRIATYEVESALVDHKAVAEAAVVGRRDPAEGEHIVAFVTPRGDIEGSEELLQELLQELRAHVAEVKGKIARPHSIVFTDDLPKTRSGQDHAPVAARCGRRTRTGRCHHSPRTLRFLEEINEKAKPPRRENDPL